MSTTTWTPTTLQITIETSDGQRVNETEFRAAVAFLQARGAKFDAATQSWFIDLHEFRATLPEGADLNNYLKARNMRCFAGGDLDALIGEPVGGYERREELFAAGINPNHPNRTIGL